MADRYLLETSSVDGYLLEDGSGVLLLDVPVTPVNKDADLRWNIATGAYIADQAASQLNTDGTSLAVTIPAHQVNDRLIVTYAIDDGQSGSSLPDMTNFDSGSNSTNVRLASWYRDITGTESWFGAGTMNLTWPAAQQAAARAFLIRDHDTAVAPVAAAATGTGTAVNPPNLDPTWGNENTLYFAVAGVGGTATQTTTPTGYTSDGQILTTGAGGEVSLLTAHKTAISTSDDPAAFDISASSAWRAVTFAVRTSIAVVGKDAELLWDVDVLSPVGKTASLFWDVLKNVGAFAQIPARVNATYKWAHSPGAADNPATSPDGLYQYVAWVSEDRHWHIAKRRHGSDFASASQQDLFNQTPTDFNALAGNDSHNYMSMAVDADGYIHLAGDVHSEPLKYMRSAAPNDIGLWLTPTMTGSQESQVTYPTFVTTDTGELLFFYRSGISGAGDWYINKYDRTTDTWSRVQAKWMDGLTEGVSAYVGVRTNPTTGRIHAFWTIREGTGGAEWNRYICYGRSDDDGLTWQKSDGTSYTLPITEATSEQLFDYLPAPPNSPILNGAAVGYDALDNPHLVQMIGTEANPTEYWYHHIYNTGSGWVDQDTGIRAGGRGDVVTFLDGTMWYLFRTGAVSRGHTLRAVDITVPGTYTTEYNLWNGNLVAQEFSYDGAALDLLDELQLIVGPARGNGIETDDSADIGRSPSHGVLIVDKDAIATVNPIIHRRGPVTSQSKTSSTTWVITPGIIASVDEWVVIAVGNNSQTLNSIVDSKSNTYVSAVNVTNASGSDLRIWYAKVTTALTVTDTITFTWASATTDKTAIVEVFTGFRTTTPVAGSTTATGTSTTPSVSRSIGTTGNLVYGAVVTEGPSGDTYTVSPDTDTAWSVVARVGNTGGSDVDNTTVARQYTTTDGVPVSRQFAPVLGTSRDWTAAVVEFASGGGFAAWVEDDDTFVATGSSPNDGTAAWNEDDDTAAAAGASTHVGTSSWTEDADTSTAAGTSTHVGTAAWTEEDDAVTAAGQPTRIGTTAWTEDDDTVAAVGYTPNDGPAAWTEDADTLAATGTVGSGSAITGTAAWTEIDDTAVAAGYATHIGTAAWTEADDTVIATGYLPNDGPAVWTEADDAFLAAGGISRIGTANWIDSDDTLDAAGSSTHSGTAAWLEDDDIWVAIQIVPPTGTPSISRTWRLLADDRVLAPVHDRIIRLPADTRRLIGATP